MFSLKIKPEASRRAVRSRRVWLWRLLCLGAAVLPASLAQAAPPGWWLDRGVIDPTLTANDYAAVNQGQVKFLAEQAAAELDAQLPGGAGDAVRQLVGSWGAPTATTNDFSAVNLGQLKHLAAPFYDQLKHLAAPFYDQLMRVGYASVFPWNGSLAQANDYAAANIGQVKNLFAFDLTSVDEDHDANGDGLPDWWETYYRLPGGVHASDALPWNPNLTYGQAFEQHLDPVDCYGGQAPVVTPASGTPQTGAPKGFAPQPLVAQVTNSDGVPLANQAVTFSADRGQVQASSSAPPVSSLVARTNSDGQARVFFQLPEAVNSTCTVTASATAGNGQSGQTSFTISSDDGTDSHVSPFSPDLSVNLHPDFSITLVWQDYSDNIASFTISRSDDGGNTWVTLGNAPGTATSYEVGSEDIGIAGYSLYRVQANGSQGSIGAGTNSTGQTDASGNPPAADAQKKASLPVRFAVIESGGGG